MRLHLNAHMFKFIKSNLYNGIGTHFFLGVFNNFLFIMNEIFFYQLFIFLFVYHWLSVEFMGSLYYEESAEIWKCTAKRLRIVRRSYSNSICLPTNSICALKNSFLYTKQLKRASERETIQNCAPIMHMLRNLRILCI